MTPEQIEADIIKRLQNDCNEYVNHMGELE